MVPPRLPLPKPWQITNLAANTTVWDLNMTSSSDLNREPPFDTNMTDALGLYVYALFDPRDGCPFYVGKGGGKHGNDRVLHHFLEARENIRTSTDQPRAGKERAKVRRIQQIWRDGHEVEWKIIRRHLRDEEEALNVEAALMDAFAACGHELTNIQGGHRSARQGFVERDSLRELAAPPIMGHDFPAELRNRPIFIFNIGTKVGKMWKKIDRIKYPKERPDYVKATQCCWKLGPYWPNQDDALAVGVVAGISRSAIGIANWTPCYNDPDRWQITPLDLASETHQAVVNRKFSEILEPVKGYLQLGGFAVIEISNTGECIFRRGSKSSIAT